MFGCFSTQRFRAHHDVRRPETDSSDVLKLPAVMPLVAFKVLSVVQGLLVFSATQVFCYTLSNQLCGPCCVHHIQLVCSLLYIHMLFLSIGLQPPPPQQIKRNSWIKLPRFAILVVLLSDSRFHNLFFRRRNINTGFSLAVIFPMRRKEHTQVFACVI